jgi:large subunit ribosomal protein L10
MKGGNTVSNLEKNRVAKQVVVDEIKERLDRTKSVVLINARGLSVAQDTTLRKTLRKAGGVDYKVYKNTMMERAIEGTAFAGLKQYLEGPTAVAFSYEDATAAAGQISKLLKGMPILEFKASVIDGEVYDADATKAIAEIPSREVLLSRLLGSFQSPMASFARVIKAIAEKNPSTTTAEPAPEVGTEAKTEAEAPTEALVAEESAVTVTEKTAETAVEASASE